MPENLVNKKKSRQWHQWSCGSSGCKKYIKYKKKKKNRKGWYLEAYDPLTEYEVNCETA